MTHDDNYICWDLFDFIGRLDGKFRFISLYPEGKDCTVCSNEIAGGRKETNFLSLKIAKSKKQYK